MRAGPDWLVLHPSIVYRNLEGGTATPAPDSGGKFPVFFRMATVAIAKVICQLNLAAEVVSGKDLGAALNH